MSNPTELPDMDKLEATLIRAVEWDARHMITINPADVLALIALARRAQPEGEAPQWGPVSSVGDLVRNLMTLEQDAPIVTAFHVDFKGERRCRAQQGISLSRERVVDGRWIDSTRKDVPYVHVLWAKPDERAAPAATLSPLCGAQHAESGALDWPHAPGRDGAQDAPSAPGAPEAPSQFERGYFCAVSVALHEEGDTTLVRSLFNQGGDPLNADPIDIERFLEHGLLPRAAQLDGGQEGSES